MRRFTLASIAAALLAVVIAATSIVAVASASAAVVKTGSSSFGRILVDSHGKTLYLWAHDRGSKSTCKSECAAYWPPLLTGGKPKAVGGASSALLGTSRRADGTTQVTYNRHPLYTFAGDKKPGQTTGAGLNDFGGRWDPVSTAGTAARKKTSSSTPIKAVVISPGPGDVAGAGGAFNVDVSLQATNTQANALLSPAAGYKPFFNDPSAPTFHPGPDPGAPGLVVLLSTTPTKAGTPLQGPNTNLAGVFQLNAVNRVKGLNQTLNTWQISSPGFFGINKEAVLTVYAVQGTAPALVPDYAGPAPISNVVRVPFTIAP